jgi:hypothetical protein
MDLKTRLSFPVMDEKYLRVRMRGSRIWLVFKFVQLFACSSDIWKRTFTSKFRRAINLARSLMFETVICRTFIVKLATSMACYTEYICQSLESFWSGKFVADWHPRTSSFSYTMVLAPPYKMSIMGCAYQHDALVKQTQHFNSKSKSYHWVKFLEFLGILTPGV